jgi:hypothetical protein
MEFRQEANNSLSRFKAEANAQLRVLQTKLDHLEAIETVSEAALRRKASELADELWADLKAEIRDLHAEIARLRAINSGALPACAYS